MPSKKSVAPRKPATSSRAKAVPAPVPAAAAAPAAPAESRAAGFRRVWTLPTALLMLIVAAGGLWLAVRDTSNAPQAASPAAAHDANAHESGSASALGKTSASAPAKTSGAAVAAASTTDTTEAARPAASKAISVTGCLQESDGAFVLKNAEGADAPKARSWKSGFLHKSTPSISLVDAGNAAHLGSHVGQRVSVTGPLVEREMRVQSLHRVAAACQ